MILKGVVANDGRDGCVECFERDEARRYLKDDKLFERSSRMAPPPEMVELMDSPVGDGSTAGDGGGDGVTAAACSDGIATPRGGVADDSWWHLPEEIVMPDKEGPIVIEDELEALMDAAGFCVDNEVTGNVANAAGHCNAANVGGPLEEAEDISWIFSQSLEKTPLDLLDAVAQAFFLFVVSL